MFGFVLPSRARLAALSLAVLFLASDCTQRIPLYLVRLPPGFHISIYAYVPNAREMALGRRGTVFVGSALSGAVYALVGRRQQGRVARQYLVARGLDYPTGIAFANGALYIAAMNRLLRLDQIEQHLARPPRPVLVTDRLPTDREHGWKFIALGPDHKLYLQIGAPCDTCLADPNHYALILRMNLDGSQQEVYARGIRNSVGFDWSPIDHTLWFTGNGRDYLGDRLPPDELGRAPVKGLDFGFPFCHAGTPDPYWGRGHHCRTEFTPPALALPAHVAPLGMRFYTGRMFPPVYRNGIFIAEHGSGSWTRRNKIGYRVTWVTVKGRQATAYRVFAAGWQQGETDWGRPADVLVMPDGSLLVSDDQAGVVYRIDYQPF
jgi:glucose/arabinose dehydrogenase